MTKEKPSKYELSQLYHEQDCTSREIAAMYDCSMKTVSRWLDRYNLPRKGPGRRATQKVELLIKINLRKTNDQRFKRIGRKLKKLAYTFPSVCVEDIKFYLFERMDKIGGEGSLDIEHLDYFTAMMWALLGFSFGIDTLVIKDQVQRWHGYYSSDQEPIQEEAQGEEDLHVVSKVKKGCITCQYWRDEHVRPQIKRWRGKTVEIKDPVHVQYCAYPTFKLDATRKKACGDWKAKTE